MANESMKHAKKCLLHCTKVNTLIFLVCAITLMSYIEELSVGHWNDTGKAKVAELVRPIFRRSVVGNLTDNNYMKISLNGNQTEKSDEHMCTPASIQEFPKGLFTDRQRSKGAVIIHILVSLYMFIALAFVCDDYFVASLDHICENFNLSEDVAGATFMAVGGSAPELFTSIIGLFVIGYGDVGPGTIVGSAVFNMLVALGLVGLFAGQATQLTCWPICRDSFSYSIAVGCLIGAMYDGFIAWYESVIMILMYLCYCLILRFNEKLVRLIHPRWIEEKEMTEKDPLTIENVNYGANDEESGAIPTHCGTSEGYPLVAKSLRKLTWRDVGMMVMLSNKFHPATRFRAACYIVSMRLEDDVKYTTDIKCKRDEKPATNAVISTNSLQSGGDHVDIKIDAGPFFPQERSYLGNSFWIISRPIAFVLHFTIPDCKKKRWARWYLVTFSMSIVWIAGLSYIMVWMVVVIGYTLGIPDVIMGITFLAAGTSVPDALASLIVARQGQGDMAVANSIGSNVFDILIGLALPWFFKTCVLNPGSMVEVNSRGLIYSVILLFTTVFITILSIHFNKWKLDRKTGLVFLSAYLIFIAFSSLIEFNVFGFVNFPTCSVPE